MTKHNATWTQDQLRDSDDITKEDEDPDPISGEDNVGRYWDYDDE
jgi:hypothetical protein